MKHSCLEGGLFQRWGHSPELQSLPPGGERVIWVGGGGSKMAGAGALRREGLQLVLRAWPGGARARAGAAWPGELRELRSR